MPYLSQLADGRLLLRLHVQPKAGRSKVSGLFDGCLKLAVQAPPVDGRANEEVLRYLAEIFSVPLRQLALVSGARGRRKQVAITGLSVAEVRGKLAPFIEKDGEKK